MSARERRAKDRRRSSVYMRRAAGPVVLVSTAAVSLVGPAISSAQAPTITVSELANLDTTPSGANPSDFTNVNGQMYFRATTGAAGTELGTSNGSPAGSSLVDIVPGSVSSDPTDLANAGGRLFFYAYNAADADQLWTSNGTATGTVDLGGGADINPEYGITNIGATAYFLTRGSGGVDELWSSDGTVANTGGVTLASATDASDLTAAGNELYFIADGTAAGTTGAEQIWSTAGPNATPEQVTEFTAASSLGDLTNVAGALYFAANGDSGEQVWTADATAASAVSTLTGAAYVDDLTADGSEVFFVAGIGGTTKLYDINNAASTVALTALSPSGYAGNGAGSYDPELTNVDGTLYFTSEVNYYSQALWLSDGTAAGTHVVSTNNATQAYEHDASELTNADGTLYYADPTQTQPSTTGVFTPNGTGPAIEAFNVPGFETLKELSSAGASLFFAANNGTPDLHLWTSNGTSSGTEVADAGIEAGDTDGSYPSEFTADGSGMYFTTSNSEGGGLWVSNGAASGTTQIQVSGAASASNLTNVSGEMFFSAGYYGYLYATDGTTAGTSRVDTGNPFPYADDLTNVGGQLFFTSDGAASGTTGESQMWKSDGSAASTVQLTSLTSSEVDAGAVNVGSEGYFFVEDTSSGDATLYASDGTPAGTAPLTDFPTGLSDIGDMTAVGPEIYFTAVQNGTRDLWVSDGSAAGTRALIGVTSLDPDVTDVSGTAFFANGVNLESSNGTVAGTVEVAPTVNPGELTNDGGFLYFAGTNGTPDGEGLWRSDGTAAGTSLVDDTDPGGNDGDINGLVNANGTLAFAATDPTHGTELWTSDGTTAGTSLADDVNPGAGDGIPGGVELANAGSTVFFSGDNGPDGAEPWTAVLPPVAPAPPTGTTPTATTPTPTTTTVATPAPVAPTTTTSTTSTPVVTTTTTTTATPPIKRAKVTLKAFKAGATSISLSLSCPVGGEKCTVKATLEIVETFRNGKLSAVTAESSPTTRKKTKFTKRTVILGTAHVTLNPGQTTTLKLVLDTTAKSLISTHKTLKVALHITQSARTTFPLLTRTITLKPAPKKAVTKK